MFFFRYYNCQAIILYHQTYYVLLQILQLSGHYLISPIALCFSSDTITVRPLSHLTNRLMFFFRYYNRQGIISYHQSSHVLLQILSPSGHYLISPIVSCSFSYTITVRELSYITNRLMFVLIYYNRQGIISYHQSSNVLLQILSPSGDYLISPIVLCSYSATITVRPLSHITNRLMFFLI